MQHSRKQPIQIGEGWKLQGKTNKQTKEQNWSIPCRNRAV